MSEHNLHCFYTDLESTRQYLKIKRKSLCCAMQWHNKIPPFHVYIIKFLNSHNQGSIEANRNKCSLIGISKFCMTLDILSRITICTGQTWNSCFINLNNKPLCFRLHWIICLHKYGIWQKSKSFVPGIRS